MSTEALIGYQTRYSIMDDGEPPELFELGEVINIESGEATAEQIDATHMQSPGKRREKIAGMIDNGDGSIQINWIPGNPTDVFLRDLFTSGEMRTHRITYPNGVYVEYNATVIGMSRVTPIDDRMTATITVLPSGDETWGEEDS